MAREPKLYSYVVEHDNGHAPNPYFDVCTLCRCKFKGRNNIVPSAKVGDWVLGTGGADLRRSAGHGKLVYAMRVDEKLTREEYYSDLRFEAKKIPSASGAYKQTRGDNIRPRNDLEKREQFVLISRHFYYFGTKAIHIPKRFDHLEKKGPGFRCDFDSAYIRRFVKWLQNHTPEKHGEPCYQALVDKSKGSKRCKSSC